MECPGQSCAACYGCYEQEPPSLSKATQLYYITTVWEGTSSMGRNCAACRGKSTYRSPWAWGSHHLQWHKLFPLYVLHFLIQLVKIIFYYYAIHCQAFLTEIQGNHPFLHFSSDPWCKTILKHLSAVTWGGVLTN